MSDRVYGQDEKAKLERLVNEGAQVLQEVNDLQEGLKETVKAVAEELNVKTALINAYQQLKIGNPLDESNHVGPLIDQDAVQMYLNAIQAAKEEGGTVIVNGGQLKGKGYESNCYVKPVIIEAKNEFKIVQHETFAPILYFQPSKGFCRNCRN